MLMPGLTALIVALLIALVFSLFLNQASPWGSAFWFFLLVFLGAWAIGSWAAPVGPAWMGVPWVPFLLGGLAIALLITAVAEPRGRPMVREPVTEPETEAAATALGIFFWVLIAFLVILIAFGGYYW